MANARSLFVIGLGCGLVVMFVMTMKLWPGDKQPVVLTANPHAHRGDTRADVATPRTGGGTDDVGAPGPGGVVADSGAVDDSVGGGGGGGVNTEELDDFHDIPPVSGGGTVGRPTKGRDINLNDGTTITLRDSGMVARVPPRDDRAPPFIHPALLYKASENHPLPLGLRMDVGATSEAVKMVNPDIPECLRSAIATMCMHVWVPVEECLADPSVVRALVPRKMSKLQKKFLQEVRDTGPSVRVNVGGASRVFEGWVLSDIKAFDVTSVGEYVHAFGGQGASAFRAEHMFEHLFPDQVDITAAMSYLFMAPGGHYRIAVPAGNHPVDDFLQHVAAGNRHQHKQLWNVDNMPPIFVRQGYDVQMMEYFEPDGTFHKHYPEDPDEDLRKWSRVYRVADEEKVRKKTYGYISLYFDAIKPEDCPVWDVSHVFRSAPA